MYQMFAIQLIDKENVQNAYETAKKLMQLGNDDLDVMMFTPFGSKLDFQDISIDVVPEESSKNNFTVKNYIMQKFEEKGKPGFLHVIEDPIKFDKDPFPFIASVQKMMDVLDYGIWFSTVTDGCNYVFNKFNPRLEFTLDDPETEKLGISRDLMFTSHSNTFWTIYHRRDASSSIQRYSDQFSISMFAIIEYLARRKANRVGNQPYFMNQYLSIREEVGTFSILKQWKDKNSEDQETMQKEDQIFKAMNVNYAPDNNIDIVLETVYQKIQEKLSSNGQEQEKADTAS